MTRLTLVELIGLAVLFLLFGFMGFWFGLVVGVVQLSSLSWLDILIDVLFGMGVTGLLLMFLQKLAPPRSLLRDGFSSFLVMVPFSVWIMFGLGAVGSLLGRLVVL